MCHMTVALDLPAGLTPRPLIPADASAVTAVLAAQELADVGEVLIDERTSSPTGSGGIRRVGGHRWRM